MQRKAVSQTDDFVDKKRLKRHLNSDDHRRILDACGFDLQGERGTDLDKILGPTELGEGETGNFSVNLDDGLVNDWGSGDYGGHVFQVVQDVHGLDFNEALEWIVEELNLDRSRLTSEPPASSSSSTSTSNGYATSPEPEPEPEPEPVLEHSQAGTWHERLMGDGSVAKSARGYLTQARGVHPKALKLRGVGLAKQSELPDSWGWPDWCDWWVVFPVPKLDEEGAPIVSVKGFAFDPASRDWMRRNGDKIPRNAGDTALLDLVPADKNGDPKIDGPVVVCEGEIDALCALSNGFNAVTGTGGAGTFKDHWHPYISSLEPAQEYGVVVAFDGDEAGRKHGPDVAEDLHEEGLDVRLANLPDGQDVNDVLMNRGTEGLRTVLDASVDLSNEGSLSPLFSLFSVLTPQSSESPPDSGGEMGQTPNNGTPEPTRLGWEDFPLSTLPDPVQKYVTAQAEAMSVDPSMIAVPGLSVLSAAVGNSRHVELQSTWKEPPTLWTMLIAESGERKSPALKKATAPTHRKHSKLKKEYDRALDAWQDRDEEERGPRPQRKRLTANDATVETVGLLHDDNPRGLLLYRDELAGWLGSFNQYNKGESDLQKWIEFYGTTPVEIDRKSSERSSMLIEDPSVAVTGSIQGGVLEDRLNALHFQSGFAARALMCEPPHQRKTFGTHDVTREVRGRYYDLVGRLYNIPMPDRNSIEVEEDLGLTREAREWYAEFFEETQDILEELPSGPLKSMVSKNEAVAARLALIFQLCEDPHSDKVEREAMMAGTTLARWLRRETARVYQNHGFSDRDVSKDRRLARQLPDGVFGIPEITQVWECSQATGYRVKDRLIEQGLLEKVDRGEYRALTTDKKADPFALFD
ncbi:DUF3987 domain-containing protein [Salinibacter ruber]|uniref:DUF3987 domain-containing protein n=1 Tax=Salinibacter ruber TaxID=146919 RepID=UPI0020742FBA|nr:DUF3987 domain-containing protein [Salinibacter ruber]